MMNVKSRLRNNLVRTIQQLSAAKLNEVINFLNKGTKRKKSKEKTLNLAGDWKDLNEELIVDLTLNLHANRTNDRQIN